MLYPPWTIQHTRKWIYKANKCNIQYFFIFYLTFVLLEWLLQRTKLKRRTNLLVKPNRQNLKHPRPFAARPALRLFAFRLFLQQPATAKQFHILSVPHFRRFILAGSWKMVRSKLRAQQLSNRLVNKCLVRNRGHGEKVPSAKQQQRANTLTQ